EIGRGENRHVRHRFFAMVDRSNLRQITTNSGSTAVTTPGTVTITPNAMSGVTDGVPWKIQVGTMLQADSGNNEENIVVTAVTATTFTATFTKTHNLGFSLI